MSVPVIEYNSGTHFESHFCNEQPVPAQFECDSISGLIEGQTFRFNESQNISLFQLDLHTGNRSRSDAIFDR